MADARRVLGSVFGFEGFRPGQEAVIEALLGGRNVLAVMPTGSGSSARVRLRHHPAPGRKSGMPWSVTAGNLAAAATSRVWLVLEDWRPIGLGTGRMLTPTMPRSAPG